MRRAPAMLRRPSGKVEFEGLTSTEVAEMGLSESLSRLFVTVGLA